MLAAPGQAQRDMDVLYLGLARGYAVSSDDEHALIGTPGPAGWSWRSAPDEAKRIRQAIRLANDNAEIRLVTLLLPGPEAIP